MPTSDLPTVGNSEVGISEGNHLKSGLFITLRTGTSAAQKSRFTPNIPPISGKHGLRNHFWSPESGFLTLGCKERGLFSKSPMPLILMLINI